MRVVFCHAVIKAICIVACAVFAGEVGKGLQSKCNSYKMVREYDDASAYSTYADLGGPFSPQSPILEDTMGEDYDGASYAPDCYLFVCESGAFRNFQMNRSIWSIDLTGYNLSFNSSNYVNVSQTIDVEIRGNIQGDLQINVSAEGDFSNASYNQSYGNGSYLRGTRSEQDLESRMVCGNKLQATAVRESNESNVSVEYTLTDADGQPWRSACTDIWWAGERPRYKAYEIPGDGWGATSR